MNQVPSLVRLPITGVHPRWSHHRLAAGEGVEKSAGVLTCRGFSSSSGCRIEASDLTRTAQHVVWCSFTSSIWRRGSSLEPGRLSGLVRYFWVVSVVRSGSSSEKGGGGGRLPLFAPTLWWPPTANRLILKRACGLARCRVSHMTTDDGLNRNKRK